LTIHNKQWHNFAASEARALGDIISESTGSIISECPGDFIGIRNQAKLPAQFCESYIRCWHL